MKSRDGNRNWRWLWQKMMLLGLVLLSLNLTSCVRLTPYYLTSKEKIWIVPKGTTVKTTEGLITTDDDLVMGYKGYLFEIEKEKDTQIMR